MRSLATSLTAISLFVFALLVVHDHEHAPRLLSVGSFEEAQAAYEADQASFSPTLTYLDDDGDGLVCECLVLRRDLLLPSSEPRHTERSDSPTTPASTGPVTPLERLDDLREERRE